MKIISKTQSDFIPDLDVWVVRSDCVDAEFRINVASPANCVDASPASFLYCLDGNYAAGTLVAAARSMGSVGELPPLFIATIGYPHDAQTSPMLQRCRDLTPWREASLDQAAALLWGRSDVSSGGGAAFLDFIGKELKPWLQTQYQVHSKSAGLTGSSLAGLFSLWALLTAPNLFDRYNIVSPSSFVADYAVLTLLRQRVAAGFAPSARVFVCAGEYETPEHLRAWIDALPDSSRDTFREFQDMLGWINMAHDAGLIADILKQVRTPGFSLDHQIFAKETHESVYLPAISRGLRSLYQTPVTLAQDQVSTKSLIDGAKTPPRFGG